MHITWKHFEIRVNGAPLPYVRYDRLSEIDQAAVVDNKRLGTHAADGAGDPGAAR